MKKYKISTTNMPTRIPLTSTAIALFLLDYYNAPGWLWGVLITILSLAWMAAIYAIFSEDYVDIFTEKDGPGITPERQSKWMQRVNEALNKK
jgi:hypothetical protein